MHALLFLSGALGLVYEVLWMRRFGLLLGATPLAASAAVSGFFLGSAAGSAFFGARLRRVRRPLVAFGLLELGVAAGALAALGLLALVERWDPTRLPSVRGTPALETAMRLLVALGAMGLPAFCMGGTLPALVGARARLGGLYAANLAGAVLGTLAVPFALLPRWGADGSYAVALGASLALGTLACVLGARRPPMAEAETTADDAEPRARLPTSYLLLGALCGAATLALQVLGMRALALVHESSVHAFATVLAVFLLGLAGGAGLARRARTSARDAGRLLGAAWLLAGLAAIGLPPTLYRLTDGLAYLPAGDSLLGVGRLLWLSAATLLPAALALGVTLPSLLDAAAVRADEAAPCVGRLLAANTLGAVAGPLLMTCLVAPALGLWRACLALGLVLVAAGAMLALPRARALGLLSVVLVACGLLDPAGLPPVRVDAARGERLVSVREGLAGTTAVLADAHDRWLTVNNSYVLGGAAALAEERFQAHLPLLLHARPRRVAFIGLGTGITAGAALAHPVERVSTLEIVAQVVAAARDDFAEHNERLLDDARVQVVVDDGRHYFAAPGESFDVVVGDLLVPWRAGESALYAREHFAAVRRALAAGGLFCQWLPVYQLSDAQLFVLARTFAEVFPRASVWRGNFAAEAPVLALVGQLDDAPLDLEALDGRVAALATRRRPEEALLAHPAGLWLHALGPLDARSARLAAAPTHSDGRPWLEMLRPLSDPRGAALLGRATALRAWEDELIALPVHGTPLQALDERRRAWRALGAALARASSGETPADEAGLLALLQTLPAELRRALHVP